MSIIEYLEDDLEEDESQIVDVERTEVTIDDIKVFKLTDDEVRQGVQNAIDEAGFSYEELAEQAKKGNFETLDAWMAWAFVSFYEFSPES